MCRIRRGGVGERRRKTNSPRSLGDDIIHHLAFGRSEGTTIVRGRAWIAVGCGLRHTSTLELKWEFEPESAAFAVLRVYTKTTFVELDDLSYERQTESGSFSTLTTTNLGLNVWREQSSPAWSASLPAVTMSNLLLHVGWSQPDTSILNLNSDDCHLNFSLRPGALSNLVVIATFFQVANGI
jgi:hypothetical protein